MYTHTWRHSGVAIRVFLYVYVYRIPSSHTYTYACGRALAMASPPAVRLLQFISEQEVLHPPPFFVLFFPFSWSRCSKSPFSQWTWPNPLVLTHTKLGFCFCSGRWDSKEQRWAWWWRKICCPRKTFVRGILLFPSLSFSFMFFYSNYLHHLCLWCFYFCPFHLFTFWFITSKP